MQSAISPASVSTGALWTGRVMSALPALFLLFDAAMKLVKPAFVVDATVALGFSESVIVPLGVVLLVCTILYLIPQTAVLGAILLTGTGVVPPDTFTLQVGDKIKISISSVGVLENIVTVV